MALQLYSVANAALLLGESRHATYRRIHRGELAWINVGTKERPRTRITHDAIEKFIAERTEGGVAHSTE